MLSDPILAQYLAALLFAIGLIVVSCRRNLFFTLMGIELMLNAVNLSFIGFGQLLPVESQVLAQVVPLFVIAIAAAEACVGLALVVALIRTGDSLDVDSFASMKE